MSYLLLEEGFGDFKKAVISLWFRVPKDKMDEVSKAAGEHKRAENAANEAGVFLPQPLFNGIIPILTFGKEETNRSMGAHFVPYREYHYQNWTWAGGLTCGWVDAGHGSSGMLSLFQWHFDDLHNYQIEPSFIGVDVKPLLDDNSNPTKSYVPRLCISIQMQDKGEYTGGAQWVSDVSVDRTDPAETWHISSGPDLSGCQWPPYYTREIGGFLYYYPVPFKETHNIITVESAAEFAYGQRPENFRTLRPYYDYLIDELSSLPGTEVTADQWHHLLLSIDFTSRCKVIGATGTTEEGVCSSAPQMHIAFDDKNKIKGELSAYWPKSRDNDFISIGASNIYFDRSDPGGQYTTYDTGQGTMHTVGRDGFARAEFDYTPSNILAKPLGIPSTDTYVDNIRQCEMGELQIFTDTTLDTSKLQNRRAFIADPQQEDSNTIGGGAGAQQTKEGLMPVNPKQAEELLRKRPVILLHGSENWKKGNNTGSLGYHDNGVQKTEGQFKSTGTIKRYIPDPQLGDLSKK